MATKKAVGRPPKYKSKEEIEEKIEEYFKECEGEILKDDEGKPIFNKFGSPVVINQRPPTVTGLALALGFSTRLSLLNYQGKKEFMNTITRAKARVEAYAEERLFDRDGSSGAQFSLRNNFKGCQQNNVRQINLFQNCHHIVNFLSFLFFKIQHVTSPFCYNIGCGLQIASLKGGDILKIHKIVKSDKLIRKYEKFGYKLLYFTYTGNDLSTMSAHLEKEL